MIVRFKIYSASNDLALAIYAGKKSSAVTEL
jgi:hypothetical protein